MIVDLQPWEPGLPGKAIVFGGVDNPGVAIWAAPGGEPHHYEVAGDAGIGNFLACEISPSGGVSVLFGDPTAAQDVVDRDPRLHVEEDEPDSWLLSDDDKPHEGDPLGLVSEGRRTPPVPSQRHAAIKRYKKACPDCGNKVHRHFNHHKGFGYQCNHCGWWGSNPEHETVSVPVLAAEMPPMLPSSEEYFNAEEFPDYHTNPHYDYDQYSPGRPGKGFILPNGKAATWNIGGSGIAPTDPKWFAIAGPHHSELAGMIGLDHYPDNTDEIKAEDRQDAIDNDYDYDEKPPGWHSPISIDAQGNYEFLNWNDNFRKEEHPAFTNAGLRRKPAEDAWRFSNDGEWHVTESDFNPEQTFFPASEGHPERDNQRVTVAHLPTHQIIVGQPGTHHADLIHHHGLDFEAISDLPRDERGYYEPVEDDTYTWTSDEGPSNFSSLHYGWISGEGGYAHWGPKVPGVTEALHAHNLLQQPDGSMAYTQDPSGGFVPKYRRTDDWHFGKTASARPVITRGDQAFIGTPEEYHHDVYRRHQLGPEEWEDRRGLVHPDAGTVEWFGTMPNERAQRDINNQLGLDLYHGFDNPYEEKDWKFAANDWGWEPGHTGKAFIDNATGQVHHWKTNARGGLVGAGLPHHAQYAQMYGIQPPYAASAWIYPDGQLKFPYLDSESSTPRQLAQVRQTIAQINKPSTYGANRYEGRNDQPMIRIDGSDYWGQDDDFFHAEVAKRYGLGENEMANAQFGRRDRLKPEGIRWVALPKAEPNSYKRNTIDRIKNEKDVWEGYGPEGWDFGKLGGRTADYEEPDEGPKHRWSADDPRGPEHWRWIEDHPHLELSQYGYIKPDGSRENYDMRDEDEDAKQEHFFGAYDEEIMEDHHFMTPSVQPRHDDPEPALEPATPNDDDDETEPQHTSGLTPSSTSSHLMASRPTLDKAPLRREGIGYDTPSQALLAHLRNRDKILDPPPPWHKIIDEIRAEEEDRDKHVDPLARTHSGAKDHGACTPSWCYVSPAYALCPMSSSSAARLAQQRGHVKDNRPSRREFLALGNIREAVDITPSDPNNVYYYSGQENWETPKGANPWQAGQEGKGYVSAASGRHFRWSVNEYGIPHHGDLFHPGYWEDRDQLFHIKPDGSATPYLVKWPEDPEADMNMEKGNPWKFSESQGSPVQNGGHVFDEYLSQRLPKAQTTEPWQLGRNGKAALLDGTLHMWATRTPNWEQEWFDPHHDGIHDLISQENQYMTMPKVEITPDGAISYLRRGAGGNKNQDILAHQIAAMHPDLRVQGDDEWRFSADESAIKIHMTDDPGTAAEYEIGDDFDKRRPLLFDSKTEQLYIGGLGQYHEEAADSHGLPNEFDYSRGIWLPEGSEGWGYKPGEVHWFSRHPSPYHQDAIAKQLNAKNANPDEWKFASESHMELPGKVVDVDIEGDQYNEAEDESNYTPWYPLIHDPKSGITYRGGEGAYHTDMVDAVPELRSQYAVPQGFSTIRQQAQGNGNWHGRQVGDDVTWWDKPGPLAEDWHFGSEVPRKQLAEVPAPQVIHVPSSNYDTKDDWDQRQTFVYVPSHNKLFIGAPGTHHADLESHPEFDYDTMNDRMQGWMEGNMPWWNQGANVDNWGRNEIPSHVMEALRQHVDPSIQMPDNVWRFGSEVPPGQLIDHVRAPWTVKEWAAYPGRSYDKSFAARPWIANWPTKTIHLGQPAWYHNDILAHPDRSDEPMGGAKGLLLGNGNVRHYDIPGPGVNEALKAWGARDVEPQGEWHFGSRPVKVIDASVPSPSESELWGDANNSNDPETYRNTMGSFIYSPSARTVWYGNGFTHHVDIQNGYGHEIPNDTGQGFAKEGYFDYFGNAADKSDIKQALAAHHGWDPKLFAQNDDEWRFGASAPFHPIWMTTDQKPDYWGDHSMIYHPEKGTLLIGNPNMHHMDLFDEVDSKGDWWPAAVYNNKFETYNNHDDPRWVPVHRYLNAMNRDAGEGPLERANTEWRFGAANDWQNGGQKIDSTPGLADRRTDPWNKGSWGKGFIHPEDETMHTWLTSSEDPYNASPHHSEIFHNMRLDWNRSSYPFQIDPEGRITTLLIDGLPPNAQEAINANPNFHLDPEDQINRWRMGAIVGPSEGWPEVPDRSQHWQALNTKSQGWHVWPYEGFEEGAGDPHAIYMHKNNIPFEDALDFAHYAPPGETDSTGVEGWTSYLKKYYDDYKGIYDAIAPEYQKGEDFENAARPTAEDWHFSTTLGGYENSSLLVPDVSNSRLMGSHHGQAVPWQKGMEGKGLIRSNGEAYLWRAEPGDPHHPEVLMSVEPRYNDRDMLDFTQGLFRIEPNGEVHQAFWEKGQPKDFSRLHPDLYPYDPTEDWKFGAIQPEDIQPWEPGYIGKAVVTPEGKALAWKTTQEHDGIPGHFDVLRATEPDHDANEAFKTHSFYNLYPDGTYFNLVGHPEHDNVIKQLMPKHPPCEGCGSPVQPDTEGFYTCPHCNYRGDAKYWLIQNGLTPGENEFRFTATASEDIRTLPPWSKDTGMAGKGFFDHETGEFHSWPVDGFGWPHHEDVRRAKGIRQIDYPVEITHEGVYDGWNRGNGDLDDRLKDHPELINAQAWRFGSVDHPKVPVPSYYGEYGTHYEPWELGKPGKGFYSPSQKKAIAWAVNRGGADTNFMGPYHNWNVLPRDMPTKDLAAFWISPEGHVDSGNMSAIPEIASLHPDWKPQREEDQWNFGPRFGAMESASLPEPHPDYKGVNEAARLEDIEPWRPGSYGKWLGYPDGFVRAWSNQPSAHWHDSGNPINARDGWPSHMETAKALGRPFELNENFEYPEGLSVGFISPDGDIESNLEDSFTQQHMESIKKQYPGTRIKGDGEWTFAKAA